MVTVTDEVSNHLFEIAGEIVVLEQDAVLQGLMPAFDLTLSLGMLGCTAHAIHPLINQPVCHFS